MSSRRDLMRQEIIRVAAKLLEQQSVDKVTLSQIAQEIGLTKAAIYHYFDTKEELLCAILAGWATACHDALEVIVASPLEPEEMLRQLLRTHVQQITSDFGLFVLSVREEGSLPESVRDELRRLKRDTDRIIQEAIKRGQSDGVFQPIDVRLAELAALGMFNWMWRWYRPGRDDPEAIADLFTRIFVEGIRLRMNGDYGPKPGGATTMLSAEFHASEIRYHTELLERLANSAHAEPEAVQVSGKVVPKSKVRSAGRPDGQG
jgi:AcrR family transcriptional regulator